MESSSTWRMRSRFAATSRMSSMTESNCSPVIGELRARRLHPLSTTSARARPGLQRIASGADLLVQCCYLAGEELVDDDLRLIADHVLASSSTVGRIAVRAGVKRLVLVHIKEKSDGRARAPAPF